MTSSPPHIVVSVVTYRRPEGLGRLLHSLSLQRFRESAAPKVTVVVVDNDSDRSAASTCMSAASSLQKLIYEVEPELGIPIARNRAFDLVPSDADFVCMIDDDEYADPLWLDNLLAAHRETDAECVYGPVVPSYPAGMPGWLRESRLFERPRFKDLQPMTYASTNNVLLSVRYLRASGVRFCEALQHSGGSDTLFFRQLLKLGIRIVWSDNALVFENVSLSRRGLGYILSRHFRHGNSHAICALLLSPTLGTRITHLKEGTLGAAWCLSRLLLRGWRGRAETCAHLGSFARSAGVLAGSCGLRFEAYTLARVQREREVDEHRRNIVSPP